MLEPMALCALLAAAPTQTLTFSQAVERSLAKHPALALARQDVARAAALTEQSRAPALPSLVAGGTYTRLDGERRLGDRVIAGQESLSANVQLQVPVLATPRWGQWYRASRSAAATVASAADVRRQVAVTAARNWLSVLGQRRVLEAAVRSREVAKAHLDFATHRRAGGLGNALDEVRAAQEYAVSQALAEGAAGQLARLEELLGVSVGEDEPQGVVVEEPRLEQGPQRDEALRGATEDRLDVKAARAREAAARSAVHTAWMDYLPLLSAVLQPFYQNPPTLTQPQTGWQAQLVLTLPLYDGGLRYGQAHEREALWAASQAQLAGAVRQAKSEVRVALEQVARADAALVASKTAAQKAGEALELANLAWRTGVSTNLEVIDAERRARDAETQAALAEDAARQARLDLLAASGRFP